MYIADFIEDLLEQGILAETLPPFMNSNLLSAAMLKKIIIEHAMFDGTYLADLNTFDFRLWATRLNSIKEFNKQKRRK